jgi:hypothetical protein
VRHGECDYSRPPSGWQVVKLDTPQLRVDVVPGKGGDLTSVVHLTTGVELLGQTRWGLRARGSMTTPGSSEAALSEAYPGGWQSVFLNAGACIAHSTRGHRRHAQTGGSCVQVHGLGADEDKAVAV